MVIDWFLRPRDRRIDAQPFFSDDELAAVRRFYGSAPDAPVTPLRSLPGLAADLGLGGLYAKDESARFGLPAFKILGARYAVAELIKSRERESPLTDLACATAGNHGRAVSRAGREHGLVSHVYVPVGTVKARIAALRAEGADVIVTDVGYDETVRRMARDADAHGWTVVSDTAWDGYEQIPRWIMAGYTWLMEEASAEWHDEPPDVVIVQAGVGSLAGGVAGWLMQSPYVGRIGFQSAKTARPTLVVAEAIGSACVLASLKAGQPVTLDSCGLTDMVGLCCAEVSPLAWRALEHRVDAAIAVPEELAREAIACLAHPVAGDPPIAAGASGAAGLAALLALAREPALGPMRDALHIDAESRVMVIVTEGVLTVS